MERLSNLLHGEEQNCASFQDLARAGCLDVVNAVGCNVASIWEFDAKHGLLKCIAHYSGKTGDFTQGQVLDRNDYRDYFDAIEHDTLIEAPDIAKHPATRCLEPYYAEYNIHSLLDVVLTDRFTNKGVLCCEQEGEKKVWTEEDVAYLKQIAAMLTKAWHLRI